MMTVYDILTVAIALKNSSTERLKESWSIGGIIMILEDAYRLETKKPELYEFRKMVEDALDRMMR